MLHNLTQWENWINRNLALFFSNSKKLMSIFETGKHSGFSWPLQFRCAIARLRQFIQRLSCALQTLARIRQKSSSIKSKKKKIEISLELLKNSVSSRVRAYDLLRPRDYESHTLTGHTRTLKEPQPQIKQRADAMQFHMVQRNLHVNEHFQWTLNVFLRAGLEKKNVRTNILTLASWLVWTKEKRRTLKKTKPRKIKQILRLFLEKTYRDL